MKFVLVLCLLSVLVLRIHASPVKLLDREARAVSRQQTAAAVPNDIVPANTADDDGDDDEDDDDDDEPDLGDLVDDDDDDEDDEDDDDEDEDDTPQGQAAPAAGAAAAAAADDDDDDDDDYLDRLFDDILGDDDDDEDDDDEVSPAASIQNTVSAAAPNAPNDIAPAPAQPAAVSAIADGVDLPIESGNTADAVVASGGNVDEVQQTAPINNVNSNNEGALTGDDDDEDADDDDDDDDDIIGDDVIEARREARELKNNVIEMNSHAFQERHNRFIDIIFSRINRIVSDNYDPFIVRLNDRAAPAIERTSEKLDSTKPVKRTTKKQQKNTNKQSKNTRAEARLWKNEETEEHLKNEGISMRTMSEKSGNTLESTAEGTRTNNKNQKTKKNSLKQNNVNDNSQNISGKQAEELEKAVGTLSGLASMKRVGNVKIQADETGTNTTIKAKFTLGPLVLRVEKAFKRGNVRNVKSATARTNEMIGRIKFNVINDHATLMSIKVQQPKQVQVESKNNHDSAGEIVWRRTPKILQLVNEKLKLATQMLLSAQSVKDTLEQN